MISTAPFTRSEFRRALVVVAGILLFAIWFARDAIAQSRTTCVLAGTVKEEEDDIVLPGATVVIQGPALMGGPQTAQSDLQGRFRFSEIPPGRYRITVTLDGFKTISVDGILISVGMTADIPIGMTPFATGGETVTVKADTKLIDPTASSVTTALPLEFLTNIPSDRDPSHILDFAPGINLESAYGGAEESGNSYELDGVDISDPQAGAPWSFFNYSLIDQVQLIGLGAPAEYGQFTGVIFNTVTRSGSNDVHGAAELFYTGKNLNGPNSGPSDLSATIEKHAEGNVQIGGPISKDRLWYFAAAQYVNNKQSEGGPIETEKDPRLFLKLTYAPTKSSTLGGWIEWDHTKITGKDGDAFIPLEATTGENNPELVGNISWQSTLSQNSILSIAWGGYSGTHHFDPQNGFLTPGHVDASTGFASSNASQFGVVDRNRNQINASITYHTNRLITGYHDLKFGTEVERSVAHDRYGYPGGAFFSDNEGPEEDPSTGEDDFFTLAYYGGGYDAHGTGKRISLFAEDSWQITPRFTLNPGIRLDINRGEVPGSTVFKTNALAPRIGFAWDLGDDGKSILKAHYGRYYEALYSAYYYYMDPGAFNPLTTQRIFNVSGFKDTLTSIPGQKYAMDPNIKQPSMDQAIVGFDQQGPYGIILSGTLVYRKNSNLIETVSRDGIFAPVHGIVPGTGQEVTLFDYLNPNTDVLIYTNPRGLHRTYGALILSATRQFAGNWQLETSYVFSKARGNIDNLGFDETGLGANTPFFDGHFLDTPNSLVNAQGRLTHDQKHQFKLQGTWAFPAIHSSFSADYTFYSGDTWTPRTDCLLTDDGNGVIGDGILDCHEFPQGPVLYFSEPRGGRRLHWASELDFHAEWHHAIGNRQQIGLIVDAFNLNNQTRATQVETDAGEEFGRAATLNFPRNVRLGIHFSF